MVLRAAALVGLGASSFLLVDYLRPAPIFCDEGCDVVRLSEYSAWFGIPTPVFGVVFFAVVLALAVMPALGARRLLVAAASVGALAALAFITIQLRVLHTVCPYCMVVDGSALVVALFAVLTRSEPAKESTTWWTSFVLVGAAAVLLPFGLAWAREKEMATPVAGGVVQDQLPEPIAREQRPGVVTVVEFVDFECPVCRRFHGNLQEAIASFRPGSVRVVRKNRPLRSIHANADSAARAYCCGTEMGKGEEMAEQLFSVPIDQLDEKGTLAIAGKLGLDGAAFQECLGSAKTRLCVHEDEKDADAAGVPEAAPIFWVGNQKFEGSRPTDVIRRALEKASQ
jgi:uncharacterized membrane protein/predicted DsbA family dithiol-disulfide isomerase